MKKYILRCIPCFLLLIFCLSGCRQTITPLTKSGFYFDTYISVTIYDASKEYVLEDCMEQAAYYENLLSPTVEGSDVWNVNHAKGAPVSVSSETVFLLERALYYASLTEGKLNPAIAPLSTLWNFSSANTDNHTVPSKADITDRLQHIDYQGIVIENQTVTLKDAEASIDLGCIAKGYIADKLKEFLLSEGVESACINLGGNVLTIGNKPGGKPFVIGVQEPFAESGTAALTVSITDASLVTSGIYERYFEQDGQLFHHILDPQTGYPVDNELASVTILSTSSMEGDALSTTCLLLGSDEGLALINSLPDTEALFITKDGTKYYTDGFPR